MTTQIYVLKNVVDGHCYGSFTNDKDANEVLLGPFPVPTDKEGPYGYPCDAEAGLDVLKKLDHLADSCQFQDLLMVFFTAGFKGGEQTGSTEREALELEIEALKQEMRAREERWQNEMERRQAGYW